MPRKPMTHQLCANTSLNASERLAPYVKIPTFPDAAVAMLASFTYPVARL
jgi:hypothetical protein